MVHRPEPPTRHSATDGTVPHAHRVLVISSELPPGPGGIGTHAHAMAMALARQGREVRVLGSQNYVSATDGAHFIAGSAVPMTTLSDKGDPVRTAVVRLRELRQGVAAFRPDVILASGGRMLWLAVMASRLDHVPVVAVAHGTELGGPLWQRRLTRAALDRCERVVAVSEFTAGLVQDLGFGRRAVDVVPNGADAARFAPHAARRAAFRARHGLGDRPVVLTVGNVTERKGQHLVVEALPRLVEAVPDVAYVVVGRPTDAPALEARARALGVADHLVLVGQVEADAVVDAHAAADVFAMTSTNTGSGDVEGFGIAVLEAALSGVPAVVTRGTGAEEAVRHGETGVAVDPDPSAIADALADLLVDDDRRDALGAMAEHIARTSATWEHRVALYGKILDEAVRGSLPRIVVVSHTEHWRADDGTIVGFGATTRELDHLASLASELVHVAPLYSGPPPGMALAPQAPNVHIIPVKPAGGSRPLDRLLVLTAVPRWATTINRELKRANVVHIRCPAGISMVALAVLFMRRQPHDRWVKYAGNWSPDEPGALTYRVQRWWLRRGLARAAVTVNGRWPDQPPWIHSFDNPTLAAIEVDRGRQAAAAKPPGPPFRVVFAGRLDDRKGADVAVKTVVDLERSGLDITLDLIGDGPLRPWVDAQTADTDGRTVRLHGWLPRAELEEHLASGHVFLLPTASEGFPKVVAEAMAFGCVPVTSGVGSLGQTLAETGGAVVVPDNGSWPDAVASVLSDPSRGELVDAGLTSAERFSFATYLDHVRALAQEAWGRGL